MRGSKGNPSPFDGYTDAQPNEPRFTLLGRDRLAPDKVRQWARERAEQVALGKQPGEDAVKIAEAYEIARDMENYRRSLDVRGQDAQPRLASTDE